MNERAPRRWSLLLRPGLIGVLALLTSGLTLSSVASAQDTENQGEAWLRARVSKKLHKRLRADFAPELRTEGTRPESYLGRLSLRYRPIKYVALTAGYRFQFKEKKDGLESRHRLDGSLVGRYPIGNFTPSLRVRYTDALNSPNAPQRRLRYRAQLAYELKKANLEFAASAAPFHDLLERSIIKMRYHFGVDYKFDKKKPLKQSIGLAYRLDYYLQEPLNVHIGLLSYQLSFS